MKIQNTVNQWVDIKRLETVVCLESVMEACYQTLAGMIHNNSARKEFWKFEQHTQYRQEELRKIFTFSQENEIAIENKYIEYMLQLRPPYSFLNVLNLAINLTEERIEVYRYFSLKDIEHQNLLNQFIEDSKQEISFLCRERNFHLSIMAYTPLKISLN